MKKKLREYQQRYNSMLEEIEQMDNALASGKIKADNCCFLLFYRQACKARDRLLDQIKVLKHNITLHEQQHGFPKKEGNQLVINF